ncbi:Cytochrome b2, mitochondrial [Lecanosticta acicola]|uniref:L-lactate dehydrogenase (cytochrome) n=1 Tax=Lecanosticta acicola TaxID=111012 RepID=A0AAI8Z5K5_9PEZI|nr:Cytochrome b2, mitochondrial [Lecanosticta acicola]
MSTIPAEELAKNNNRNSCWIAINGTIWDVTAFIDQHPGGASLILRVAGQDATEQYETFHDADLVEKTLGPGANKGTIDPRTILKPESKPTPKGSVARGPPPLKSIIALADFEKVAERHMTPLAWAYISSGSDNEVTLRENARIYQKVFLRGRILRKVGSVDLSTTILGHASSLPIYTSPVGLAKLVHPEGECAIAKADGIEGVVQVVNTVSSVPIEEIMKARISREQPVFWQLYLNKELEKSREFIERVEKTGVKAIWLTVDSPVTGNRERDERSKEVEEEFEEDLEAAVSTLRSTGVAASNNSFINADADWEIIDWLRSVTKLPIVVKGIQCVEDAILAYEHKVDGIVLSNHGGRSQDTSQPPLLTLYEIRKFAPHIMGREMQIFVDGGVRRGTDVLKALCLGASAVGIGRPVLFSMAAGYGHYGVRRMLQILRKEMQTNMAFLGARKIEDLRPEMANVKALERKVVGECKL